MTKTHIVMGDAHANAEHNNDRAEWIGKLLLDIKPDVFIDIGDSADFPSLSSYDRNTRSFVGRSYRADVLAYLDYQERLFRPIRASKKKQPRTIRLIGNHEQRIDRALDLSPELVNTIGYSDLDLERYYDEVVHYDGNTPGIIEIDGVSYSHFFTSGIMGRPIGGEHPAYSLITKRLTSCTQGHSHLLDYTTRKGKDSWIMGLHAGCFIDYKSSWAGNVQSMWSPGVAIKRNVDKGAYDLEWISLERLKREYGSKQE